ncbi:hypothetical protein [Halobacteriovorax sp. ZH2_bin.1]|uniref:hypothetical protein n=1 Tax=unclassified Halobacteriovorax TaxID=2639665 RepID=UPI00370FF707
MNQFVLKDLFTHNYIVENSDFLLKEINSEANAAIELGDIRSIQDAWYDICEGKRYEIKTSLCSLFFRKSLFSFSCAFNEGATYYLYRPSDANHVPQKITIKRYKDSYYEAVENNLKIEIQDGFLLDKKIIYIEKSGKVDSIFVPTYYYIREKIILTDTLMYHLNCALLYRKVHQGMIICSKEIGDKFIEHSFAVYDDIKECYTIRKEHEEHLIDYLKYH